MCPRHESEEIFPPNRHVNLVTVRLAPLLKTDVAVAQFPSVRNATEAVKDILNKGIGIRMYGFCSVVSVSN